MPSRLQQVLSLCWQSPVYGDSFKSSAADPHFEQRMEDAANRFAGPFASVIAEAMPDIPPARRDAFVHRTKFWVAWLMTIDGHLSDPERLTAAALCLGLMGWGDTFMDQGDAATEAAVSSLLDEHGALPPELSRIASRLEENGAAEPSAIQARLTALHRFAPQIDYLSHPEDAHILLEAPCLNFLAHSLGVRRLSQEYLHEKSDVFWEKYAEAYAKHSILNIQIVGMCGLYYTLYRHEDPKLPSLAEIMHEPQLMRYLDRLANAAIRVFDDVGDRKVDAGATNWNQFTLNLFNARDPGFTRAFFRFAGVDDKRRIDAAIEALQSDTHEGDVVIVGLFIDLLREELEALPKKLTQRYGVFLTTAKRFIETGYANAMGDPAFY